MRKYIPYLLIPFVMVIVVDYSFGYKKNKMIISTEKIQKDANYLSSDFELNMINKIYSEKFAVSDKPRNFITPDNSVNNSKQVSLINSSKEINIINSLKKNKLNWKEDFSNKKINFIETLLPLIAYENQKIIFERKNLIKIRNLLNRHKTLSKNNIQYLDNITKKYNIISMNKHKIDIIDQFLASINIIPHSIVLAQAANESGWGTSRFAKEHNALFGQYTYDENKGVVPYERAKGKKYLIKNFSSINKSVESYFKNINTHYAYADFRKTRNKIINENKSYNIKTLTATLKVYAEDESYVKNINSIIDSNNLVQFDYKVAYFPKS